MPNIEIISIRFNLGKDIDRRLFQVLQERSDNGKRNEFLKKILFECLVKEPPEGKQASKLSKKQAREQKEPVDTGRISGVTDTGPADNQAGTAETQSGPPVSPGDQIMSSRQEHYEPHPEAAGIVSQFVQ